MEFETEEKKNSKNICDILRNASEQRFLANQGIIQLGSEGPDVDNQTYYNNETNQVTKNRYENQKSP